MSAKSEGTAEIFYGWYIVAAGFITMLIHAGVGFYPLPVFFVELNENLGWGRAATNMGFSITFIMGGLASPVVGRLLPNYGPRKVVVVSAIIMSAAFMLFSVMQTLWQFYIICMMVAIGWCCNGPVATSFAVSDWFEKKRGRAMGTMMVGIGLGGLLFPSLTRRLIDIFEWRMTFMIYAVFISVVLIPVAAAIFKRRPADVSPDGELSFTGAPPEEFPEEVSTSANASGLTLRDAIRSFAFWIIAAAFILAIFGQTALLINQVPYFQDIGISPEKAASALGICAFVGVAGKVFFGSMADRCPARYAMALCFGIQSVGTIVLLSTPALGSPYWFSVIWGFGMGGIVALQPLIVAECFGLKSFGVILGMVYVFTTIGGSLGAPFAGFVFDKNNSYFVAFVLFAATYFVAAGLSFLAVPPISPAPEAE